MPDDHRYDGATQTRGSPGAQRPERSRIPSTANTSALTDRLEQAALSSDPEAIPRMLARFLVEDVGPHDIADIHIPAAARSLGDAWCKDEIGFANVTIGCSRLQSMLRELGQFWTGDGVLGADAPTVLLIVGYDIHHTLGAMVLSSQLRRKGISVRVMLNAKAQDAALAARRGNYDAIFMSASCGERLESLRYIVESIKREQEHQTPIVIGGTILTEADDVQAKTGADYTTNDPDEALALCGLTKTKRSTPKIRELS